MRQAGQGEDDGGKERFSSEEVDEEEVGKKDGGADSVSEREEKCVWVFTAVEKNKHSHNVALMGYLSTSLCFP